MAPNLAQNELETTVVGIEPVTFVFIYGPNPTDI